MTSSTSERAVIDSNATPGGGRSTESPPPGHTRRRRGKAYQYWFALPAIGFVAVFFAAPFLANTAFAFLQWTNYSSVISWTGLNNFRELIELGILWHAVEVTLIFAITSMTVQNVVGLVLAKALQGGSRADRLFRSIFFIPVLFSPLAAGYLWAALLQSPGPINSMISAVVPGTFTFDWLGHSLSALLLVGIIDGWKWSGLTTIVYIAGLNRIPVSLLEAARLDGAGPWKRFRRVELPLLVPAISFNMVVGLVGSFSTIDVIFAMTGGGPGDATTVLNVELYSQYAGGQFGTASALALSITVIAVLAAVPMIAWLRRREVQM